MPASDAMRHLVGPGDIGARLVLHLAPDPSAAQAARRALRALLGRTGQEEWVDAAELACTELVTNVVLHAHTTMTVTVESLTDELRVEVSDTSIELPRQRTGTEGATTGRGLLLVAQIAATHGVRRDPTGKTVWFTLRAPVPGDDDEPTAEDLLGMWDDEPDGASSASSSSRADDGAVVRAPTARRPVRLVGLPALLWLAAEEHHRTLLRELVLYRADPEGLAPETGLSAGHREDADLVAAGAAHTLLGGAVAAAVRQAQAAGQARRPLPEEHPADLPWVPSPMDLELDVAPGAVADFAALQNALDLAERLAEGGQLLARPGLPEIVAVRDWACEQVLAQASGSPAGAWPGTDQERFVAQEHLPAEAGSDLDAVRSASGAVVAADDSNRIVAISPAMAHLVRWDAEQLVGRRVVTLIPAELREAHVAGFSRHLTTGQARLLGVPLALPVLRSDGSVVRCTVTIEQATQDGGRRLYLARFDQSEPVDPVDASCAG